MKIVTLFYWLSMLLIFSLMKGCTTVPSSSMEGLDVQGANYIERALDDRMLIMDIQTLFDKLALVKNLLSAKIYDAQLQRKTHGLTSQLTLKRKSLLACSRLHQNKKNDLALDCAYLAHKVAESDESTSSLDQVKKLIADKARRSLTVDKAELKASKNKGDSIDADYKESINALNHLLLVAPKNTEASKLLKQLKSTQEKRIAKLMAKGDKLYREQKVEKALAIWREAADLDAKNQSIAERIARANKVLGGVNKIKKQPK